MQTSEGYSVSEDLVKKENDLFILYYIFASNPVNLGIGLGEDTGLLITNGNTMEAIGSGLIILVDATQMRKTNITDVDMGEPVSMENLIVHVMSIHDHFDLKTKKLVIDHFKPTPKIS